MTKMMHEKEVESMELFEIKTIDDVKQWLKEQDKKDMCKKLLVLFEDMNRMWDPNKKNSDIVGMEEQGMSNLISFGKEYFRLDMDNNELSNRLKESIDVQRHQSVKYLFVTPRWMHRC
ncbi:hypothetical protein GQ473_06135 [archaeon]|nr:hypothetical protein [archaeon]